MGGDFFFPDYHGNIVHVIKEHNALQHPTTKSFQSDYWFLDVSFSGYFP